MLSLNVIGIRIVLWSFSFFSPSRGNCEQKECGENRMCKIMNFWPCVIVWVVRITADYRCTRMTQIVQTSWYEELCEFYMITNISRIECVCVCVYVGVWHFWLTAFNIVSNRIYFRDFFFYLHFIVNFFYDKKNVDNNFFLDQVNILRDTGFLRILNLNFGFL